MNIYEKLLNIQSELKAPKNQRNNFGGYNYRSCEDILEAVKPLTVKNKVTLVLADEIHQVGDRIYVMAIARLIDVENENNQIAVTAYARESETKKGMDDSQITGTASSYARKYALNGLFNIDDTKDADTDEYTKANKKAENKELDKLSKEEFQVDTKKKATKKVEIKDEEIGSQKIDQTYADALKLKMDNEGRSVDGLLKYFKVDKLEDLTMLQYTEALDILAKSK